MGYTAEFCIVTCISNPMESIAWISTEGVALAYHLSLSIKLRDVTVLPLFFLGLDGLVGLMYVCGKDM